MTLYTYITRPASIAALRHAEIRLVFMRKGISLYWSRACSLVKLTEEVRIARPRVAAFQPR